MVAILLVSSIFVMLGKDLFKHGMSASFRVGATVGANVTAFIVLLYTGVITSYLNKAGAQFGVTAVLAYICSATHFIYGVTLFWYRDHVVPGEHGEDASHLLPTPSVPAPPAAASQPPPQQTQAYSPPRAPPANDNSNPWV